MGVQIHMSVGIWRANENSNPCNNPNEILHTHLHLFKEGFGASLTHSLSSHLEPVGPKTL